MTLVDTNLLVYATFADAPEHDAARAWLEAQLESGSVVLCWPVVYSFVRLVTSERVFHGRALRLTDAWHDAHVYLRHPSVRVVVPGPRHAAIAGELLATPGLHSADVPDVELGALAIEHGLVLASHDHGFRRFAKLRFLDPLTA